jgi:hypothetical protein
VSPCDSDEPQSRTPVTMEFIDPWDSQSRARVVHFGANSTSFSSSTAKAPLSLRHAASCAAAVVALLAAAFYLLPTYQILSSLLIWIASSLLLAPFVPLSAIGGDISVDRGCVVPAPEPAPEPTRAVMGGRCRRGRGRAARPGLGRCCSVGTERSEAREGRREVRGERRGKGEIEAAAAEREARERAAARVR